MRRKKFYLPVMAALLVLLFVSGCARPQKTADNASKETSSDASSKSSGTEITEAEAKKIAFDHAQVKESDTTAMQVKKEIDDGISIYKVEFYVQDKEYDYEIKAADGTILSSDFDIDHDFNASSSGVKFSEADAKKLVLAKVSGATEKDMQMKLDHDDGRQVYEGKVIYNNIEYEFSIDANTGDFLEWSQESVFD